MADMWGVYNRFIPAGAGNTTFYSGSATAAPVYPRWRGEHRVKRLAVALVGGLSPLARGTRTGWHTDPDGTRFIPAGAGNTQHQVKRVDGVAVYPRWRGEHIFTPLFCIN